MPREALDSLPEKPRRHNKTARTRALDPSMYPIVLAIMVAVVEVPGPPPSLMGGGLTIGAEASGPRNLQPSYSSARPRLSKARGFFSMVDRDRGLGTRPDNRLIGVVGRSSQSIFCRSNHPPGLSVACATRNAVETGRGIGSDAIRSCGASRRDSASGGVPDRIRRTGWRENRLLSPRRDRPASDLADDSVVPALSVLRRFLTSDSFDSLIL